MHRPGTHEGAAYNAALRGASLAFQRTPAPRQPPTTPTASNRSLDNGALIAATSASQDRSLSCSPPRAQAPRLSRHTTGSTPQGHLLPPPKHTMADPRSPSFIAATLAASRSGSPSPHSTAQNVQQASRRRRKESVDAHSAASSVTSLDITTDTSPIPSANALISMFEKGDDDTDPVKKGMGVPNTNNRLAGTKPTLRPMTPPRALSPVAKHDTSPSRLASTPAWERVATPPASGKDMDREQAITRSVESRRRPPTPPPARSKAGVDISIHAQPLGSRARPRATTPPPKAISRSDTVILSPRPRRVATERILPQTSSEAISTHQSRKPPLVKPKLRDPTSVAGPKELPAPLDNGNQVNAVARQEGISSSSSSDTFVSASSAPSTHPNSPRRGRSRPPTPDLPQPSARLRPPTLPQRPSQSNLPLELLTNAIVAGSLASSRMTPTTSRPPTPPPPARKQTPHMRQTLRKPPSKSDDEEEESRTRSRHRKKSLGKLGQRNKHSHHEGARKRWREEITPRERKRYEGVWASNRGYLLAEGLEPSSTMGAGAGAAGGGRFTGRGGDGDGGAGEQQLVANVVVRDIWARSRLPFDELAEVWDLVDRRARGALDKAEFVVGMWLIDQRLRGRKIPRKVGESVWGSAKGVRVLGPKEKK